MKISLNWLQTFAPMGLSSVTSPLKDIAHMYSIHTAEIEGYKQYSRIDKVVVGKIVECTKHPESTKLWICTVLVGFDSNISPINEVILTGAQNVSVGMYVPTALVGAKLSDDFVISERKMAGMLSRGMLCGPNEIGILEHDTGGIQDLLDIASADVLESKIGTSIFDLPVHIPGTKLNQPAQVSIEDAVFEIDNKNITNRPDLFGIIGHAREFGALTKVGCTFPETTNISSSEKFSLSIETPHVFSYSVAKIEGIKVLNAPFGIRMLLERSGHSTHDAIVDMTNYVMMECGQPLHAFDADCIVGGIVVRQARAGEKIIALDGKEYDLIPDDIVIADSVKVLAIAGVMGGIESGITAATKNICIESAVFDPVKIRLTAQRLGLRSDASTRFEKSIDPVLSSKILGRAWDVLQFSGVGGTITASNHFISPTVKQNTSISISKEFIEKRLGVKLDTPVIVQYLESLEFGVDIDSATTDTVTFSVRIPSFRATKDITIPEDIVEEIGRLIGYDVIEEYPMSGDFAIVPSSGHPQFRTLVQDYFQGCRMYEAFNYSFSNEKKDELAGITNHESAISIRNAVSSEFTLMRRSLAPLLLQSIHNNRKLVEEVLFFEIAKVHQKDENGQFIEKKMIGGVLSSSDSSNVRKILDGLLSRLGIRDFAIRQGTGLPFIHPMVAGEYLLQGVSVIRFGKIHPKTAVNFEIPDTAWYFECEYNELFQAYIDNIASGKQTYIEPSRFPIITRELNFVLNFKEETASIANILSSVDVRIAQISVVDIFVNTEKVGANKKSVTFQFSIIDREKTITDEEALAIQNTCIEAVVSSGIGTLRN